jgi:16S rRNA (cytosine1402-N4)-methyltransferase
MRDEMVALLLGGAAPVRRAFDGTLGAGGHSHALLAAGVESLIGVDVDTEAIALATARLAEYGPRARIQHASYLELPRILEDAGWSDGADAIVLDLGASSMQFDQPERGFAFRFDGPLDMRFDQSLGTLTAGDIVNDWGVDDLAELLYRYGEERHGRRVARAIVAARPITGTAALASVVQRALPRAGTGAIHPATRTFQALRIAVNDELNTLEMALQLAMDALRPGGRLGVLTFHSLEDRLVKRAFRDASLAFEAPPGMASLASRQARVSLVNRRPLGPSDDEIARNPRSRSAKLRVVERLPGPTDAP